MSRVKEVISCRTPSLTRSTPSPSPLRNPALQVRGCPALLLPALTTILTIKSIGRSEVSHYVECCSWGHKPRTGALVGLGPRAATAPRAEDEHETFDDEDSRGAIDDSRGAIEEMRTVYGRPEGRGRREIQRGAPAFPCISQHA